MSAASIDTDEYSIAVYIDAITGVKPLYTHSGMMLVVEYLKEILYESDIMRSGEQLMINHLINIQFTLDDIFCIDKVISNPLIIKLVEIESEVSSVISMTDLPDAGRAWWMTETSLASIGEALRGSKLDLEDFCVVPLVRLAETRKSNTSTQAATQPKKKSAKEKRSSKDSKGSRGSKQRLHKYRRDSRTDSLSLIAGASPIMGPQMIGYAYVDLSPLFLGVESYETEVILRSSFKSLDDRVRAANRLPKIRLGLSINRVIPRGFVYNCCVESIYNLSQSVTFATSFQLCLHLPSSRNRYLLYDKSILRDEPRNTYEYKKFADSNYDSPFVIRKDFADAMLYTQLDYEMEPMLLGGDCPRLEFNSLKRVFCLEEDLDVIRNHLRQYRCLGVEVVVYVSRSLISKETLTSRQSRKTGSIKDNKGRGGNKYRSPSFDSPRYDDTLHMMGFLDVCRLLYPGERYARSMVTLHTFHDDEFRNKCGVRTSYFRQQLIDPQVKLSPMRDARSTKSSGTTKSSKSVNLSKDSKVVSGSRDLDLSSRLPDAPIVVGKSQPVYNEQGLQTFVMIEIEFAQPLEPAPKSESDSFLDLRTVSDLDIIPMNTTIDYRETNKFYDKSCYVTETYYKQTIGELAHNLRNIYAHFAKFNPEDQNNVYKFIDYLVRKGYYSEFVNRLTHSSLEYVNTTLTFNPVQLKTNFNTHLTKMYIQLVEASSDALMGGDEDSNELNPINDLVKFAFEAMELNFAALANRYFLQCICTDPRNAQYWCNFAIYNLHVGEAERAIECIKEALGYNEHHRDSLVMYGIMLARKRRLKEAETFLLNVTLNNPEWVEGWGALYCIYLQKINTEGMEVALELGLHYLHTPMEPLRDLIWNDCLTPLSFYLRTTRYFIQLRLLDEAEMMLAPELSTRYDGHTEYLLSVIQYYRKDLSHAMQHIEKALQLGGNDYIKCAFKGHLYASQQHYQCAVNVFNSIAEFYNQPGPEFFYLMYIQRALCYSTLGNGQQARIEFMRACKLGGSAYTWLCVGILYYHQHDYLSADECLTYSNFLDNHMAETWAYLTLVHLKLKKRYEASICYHQTKRLRLENARLLSMIDEEFNDAHK